MNSWYSLLDLIDAQVQSFVFFQDRGALASDLRQRDEPMPNLVRTPATEKRILFDFVANFASAVCQREGGRQ